jgi:hypothetical protein
MLLGSETQRWSEEPIDSQLVVHEVMRKRFFVEGLKQLSANTTSAKQKA